MGVLQYGAMAKNLVEPTKVRVKHGVAGLVEEKLVVEGHEVSLPAPVVMDIQVEKGL